jgi:hypothetical protein
MPQAFFIGGPLNNRLVDVSDEVLRNPRGYLRVPDPPEIAFAANLVDAIMPNMVIPHVDYRRDAPLSTGTPVFTCLPL